MSNSAAAVAAIATTLMLAAASATAQTDDPLERNRLIIHRYFEEVWNQGNLDALDELIHPDYINHSPGLPNPLPGAAGLKPIVAAMRQGLPDLHYTIEDIVVSADKVAVRVTFQATHTGNLFGIAPTGRRITVDQMQIEHIHDGRIIAHWRRTDDLGMMKQLGLLQE